MRKLLRWLCYAILVSVIVIVLIGFVAKHGLGALIFLIVVVVVVSAAVGAFVL